MGFGFGGGYDSTPSTLLCQEENKDVLGFDEEDGDLENGGDRDVVAIGSSRKRQDCDFVDDYGDDLMFMDFPLMSDECLALSVSQESYHLPRNDYSRRLLSGALDISVRREAIDWIGKVHAHYSFGPLSAYLSINYLDRFLSFYELPQGKAWMTQLLSVACLSLAAKMEETEVPPSLDLQIGDTKFIFEPKTIQRMELLVLSTLGWRMRAVTPFSFTDYFLHKFNNGKSPSRSSISRSVDLILNTITRIDFLEFKPSEVAAAVALCVTGETHMINATKILSYCNFINQERAMRCYEVTKDMALIRRPYKSSSGSASSVPQSPIGVLDNACQSYKSDDTATVGSLLNSQHCSPDAKKRKINTQLPSS